MSFRHPTAAVSGAAPWVPSQLSLIVLAALCCGGNAFFKGSDESAQVITPSGAIVPSVPNSKRKLEQGLIKDSQDEMSETCMSYAVINEEVSQGAEANKKDREAKGEAEEDDLIESDEEDGEEELDPEVRAAADKANEVASEEARKAGSDTFDEIFGDDDPDEEDDSDDDAESDVEDVGENDRHETRIHALLRSIFGDFGNESAQLASDESEAEDVEEEDCAHPLTQEELNMAKCPPGEYLGHNSKFSIRKREKRLRKAICLAKSKGYRRGVDPENSHYLHRGYMTYESSIWPKPHTCRTLPDQAWYQSHKASMKRYRPDRAPEHYTKEVCHKYKLEFHKSWKVASTSFPDYLKCQYSCNWQTPSVDHVVGKGHMVVAAVREPIARFLSAASELLERSLNKWCPTGQCGKTDGFVYGKGEGTTHDKFMHQTSWYKHVCPATGGYTARKLKTLVKYMVKDTVCNYYTYASEHLSTQANFITQNAGPAARISRILKLEGITGDLADLHKAVAPKESKTCKLGFKNVKSCKPNAEKVPSATAILKELKNNKQLLKELCLMYAQDFICFDYNLPWACKGMF